MHHIIPPANKVHKPAPTFYKTSKIIPGLFVMVHPFLAFLCVLVADMFASSISTVLLGIAQIYDENSSLSKFEFAVLSKSPNWYTGFLVSAIVFTAYLAGSFKIFKIKSFWMNFVISLFLLVISLYTLRLENFSAYN